MSNRGIFLFSKDGFEFMKNDTNNYTLKFEMENRKMDLSKIINFDLIKLIFDLNPDIFETCVIDKLNHDEATVAVLVKNLFEDLGLPQSYSYLRIRKVDNQTAITFLSTAITETRPISFPIQAKLLPFDKILFEGKTTFWGKGKMEFIFNINIKNDSFTENHIEKIIGQILFKMFSRLKQFIENIEV